MKRILAALLVLSVAFSCALPARAALGLQGGGQEEDTQDDGWADDEGYEEEEPEPQSTVDNSGIQAQLDALNNKMNEVKKQRDAITTKLSGIKNEQDKKMQEKLSWQEQIDLTAEHIALMQQRIALYEQKITDKQQEIELKQADIDHNYEVYKKRMRSSFMQNQSSTLAMVLGANSFTDFLMRAEMVNSIAEHDKALLDTLRRDRAALEEAKAELDETKKGLEADKAGLEEEKQRQQGELEKVKDAIQDIALEQAYYQQNKQQLDRQSAELQKEIERIYELLKPQMADEYVGGEFAWPLPGHRQVTSGYAAGDRSDNHTGIDLAGGVCYGASIVAANDGKVVYAASTSSGYGKYVIVDHGGGVSTLYAHMSAISVSVGQSVTRGQTEIGKVGQSGWATGPHLHFEVRINGKPVSPGGYIGA